MGYSFYLISKEKDINKTDFEKAMSNLSNFNLYGEIGVPVCDVDFNSKYIRISGSFGISGNHAEGFVLNLLICLTELNYNLKVISGDWEYGSKEDWEWLKNNCNAN